jgi:hypothetical protein
LRRHGWCPRGGLRTVKSRERVKLEATSSSITISRQGERCNPWDTSSKYEPVVDGSCPHPPAWRVLSHSVSTCGNAHPIPQLGLCWPHRWPALPKGGSPGLRGTRTTLVNAGLGDPAQGKMPVAAVLWHRTASPLMSGFDTAAGSSLEAVRKARSAGQKRTGAPQRDAGPVGNGREETSAVLARSMHYHKLRRREFAASCCEVTPLPVKVPRRAVHIQG